MTEQPDLDAIRRSILELSAEFRRIAAMPAANWPTLHQLHLLSVDLENVKQGVLMFMDSMDTVELLKEQARVSSQRCDAILNKLRAKGGETCSGSTRTQSTSTHIDEWPRRLNTCAD